MEFTHEQITEIISEITNGEQGLQGLVKQGLESLMLSERSIHNYSRFDIFLCNFSVISLRNPRDLRDSI